MNLLALMLGLAAAPSPEAWAPVRWQGEPLELLAGAPVNCLLVAPGTAPTAVRQASEKGFVVVQEGDGRVVASAEGVTARLRLLSEEKAEATPTSEPWIYSNTWLVRSLRASAGPRPVWLTHRLQNPGPEDYLRAIADAAAAGGRWVVTLEEQARAAWGRIGEYLRFYEEHADWRRFQPLGPLLIVQDPAYGYAEVSGENLNLIARRQVPYRVILRRDLSAAALAGFRAVLATDLSAPTTAERTLLEEFARSGGLLFAGPAFKPGTVGQGEVVAYKDDPADPEALARDVRELLGSQSPVRLYNVPSVLGYAAAAPGGGRVLVHLVNYATEPAEKVRVRLAGGCAKAVLYAPGTAVRQLSIDRSGGACEVVIPSVLISAALVVEK